jgi:hypothetical protein
MVKGPVSARVYLVIMGYNGPGQVVQVISMEFQVLLGSGPKNGVYIANTSVHGLLQVHTGLHMYGRLQHRIR